MHILHGEVSISKATHLVVLCTHTSIYLKAGIWGSAVAGIQVLSILLLLQGCSEALLAELLFERELAHPWNSQPLPHTHLSASPSCSQRSPSLHK